MGFGDYPDLPKISVDMKSDWEEYDDFYLKRNFGEPVILNISVYSRIVKGYNC